MSFPIPSVGGFLFLTACGIRKENHSTGTPRAKTCPGDKKKLNKVEPFSKRIHINNQIAAMSHWNITSGNNIQIYDAVLKYSLSHYESLEPFMLSFLSTILTSKTYMFWKQNQSVNKNIIQKLLMVHCLRSSCCVFSWSLNCSKQNYLENWALLCVFCFWHLYYSQIIQ